MSRTTAGEWDSLVERETTRAREAEFALLVERQSQFVFRVAYAVLRNIEDAEDVAQDTFLKLFRTGAWNHIEDERAFLARMAWRLAIGKRPARRLSLGTELNKITCNESSPEASAIATERSRTIHRLIDALPEKLRRPLALSSIEGMTAPQISAVMGLPEGTVRRLITEARTLVKEKMERMKGSRHA